MSTWPLILPHADITRVVNRNASRLISTRTLKRGAYQLQDAHIVDRNARYRKDGRWDLHYDPGVVTVEISEVASTTLMALDLGVVRAAGFKTQRDFYDDWLERRGWVDPDLEIRVYRFSLTEPVRMLHRNVHRGYTTNTADAARDEPSALSVSELRRYADTARWRDDQERRALAHLARLRKRRAA